MDRERLQEYLHAHIPLSAAMSAQVREAGPEGLLLEAQARALPPDPAGWSRFLRTLERWRKGRLAVRVEVLCQGRVVGTMAGEYVSLLGPDAP